MIYAAKHGYNDIADEAAPLLLGIPLGEVLMQLPNRFVAPWVRCFIIYRLTKSYRTWSQTLYHSSWDKVLRLARSFPTAPGLDDLIIGVGHTKLHPFDAFPPKCSTVDRAIYDVLMRLNDLQSLQNLVNVFTSSWACDHVKEHLDSWRRKIEIDVIAIKAFSTYL